jgi:acetolactate synthase regulatory subunit
MKVLRLYRHQGFRIVTINANPEFQPLQEKFGYFNLCAQGKHVPEVERYIRTVKDRTRSGYNLLTIQIHPVTDAGPPGPQRCLLAQCFSS